MKIVHGDQIKEKIRFHQHRQGMFRHRRYTTVSCEFEAVTSTELLAFGPPQLDTPAHHAIAAE